MLAEAPRLREQLNLDYIKNCTKACPQCKNRIAKNDGCNKMTCSICRIYFCWACGKRIEGYDHFQISPDCNLWAKSTVPTVLEDERIDIVALSKEQLTKKF